MAPRRIGMAELPDQGFCIEAARATFLHPSAVCLGDFLRECVSSRLAGRVAVDLAFARHVRCGPPQMWASVCGLERLEQRPGAGWA
eukprot:3944971-Pyramimonas_sp.AAC.1